MVCTLYCALGFDASKPQECGCKTNDSGNPTAIDGRLSGSDGNREPGQKIPVEARALCTTASNL